MLEFIDPILKALAPYPLLQFGIAALVVFLGYKTIKKGESDKQDSHEPSTDQRERWEAFRNIQEIKVGIDRLNETQLGIANGLKALAAAVHNRMQWDMQRKD